MYFIKTKGNEIVLIGYTKKDLDLKDDYLEITKEQYDYINEDTVANNYKHYKVDLNNNQLTKRSQQEIDEIQQYGKILTDSERTLNKLIPSHEEVQKAQTTIEILTLIQEVF